MTTTLPPVLAVADLAACVKARGYRITVALVDVFVAERDVVGVRRAMRRVVGQRNQDGSLRVGYLFVRPGTVGGPIYEHELVARDPACRDLATFAVWIATQDARPFPAPAAV